MHLIYARFWTKVGRDLGLHSHDEPFQRLLTQGMINKIQPYCSNCDAFAMKGEINDEKCNKCGGEYVLKSVKMSKSYGNTVDPTEIIDAYGADAARFFILFGASPSSGLEWSDEGVGFANKFMNNTYQLLTESPKNYRTEKTVRDTIITYILNKTIKEISENIDKIAIRNAVNALIQFASELSKYKNEGVIKEIYEECREKFTLLLHPIAPHITEEIWQMMGKKGYLSLASWPSHDDNIINAENEFKYKLMNKTIDSINHIKLILKKKKLEKITIVIADDWKFKFMSKTLELLEKTKNQGEIMKQIMQDNDLKPHGKFIGQTLSKILKNVGKFSKTILSSKEEYQIFLDLKPIFEQKYESSVEILHEKESKE